MPFKSGLRFYQNTPPEDLGCVRKPHWHDRCWSETTRLILGGIGLVMFSEFTAVAAVPVDQSPALASLSFEQLSQIQVITVSKRAASLVDTPAVVRVITSEDIQRSGATSIPEALRDVPGLNVAQINNSAWAIGARGFPWQYASKMLVMIDGRSVYSPMFGGVFWDQQDYLLEDLDRIEVVLGPGSSIWGANAVNGVINILTKSAKDTQGGLVYAGGGNEKLALTGGRYGWKLGEDVYARVYLKYSALDDTRLITGGATGDSLQMGQGGFRLDGELNELAKWTLQGDGYRGHEKYLVDLPNLNAPPTYLSHDDRGTDVSGANVLGRWETTFSDDSILHLQAYYDYAQRESALINSRVQMVDFEAHHTWSGWERQKIDWGLGYRMVSDQTEDAWVTFSPQDSLTHLFSVFVQDEWSVVPDKLTLTAGLKVEHNDYTGFEPQPSARLSWRPVASQTVWGAWSRAVRTPTRVESFGQVDARVFPPGVLDATRPAVLRVGGNDTLRSEQLDAWELGWRWQASERLSFDLSVFYNQYNKLMLIGSQPPYVQPAPGPAVIIPSPYGNGLRGEAYGGEIAAQWQPLDHWQLRASYSGVSLQLHAYQPDPIQYEQDEKTTPHHTVGLQSRVNLTRNLDWDMAFRYVDSVPYYQIPGYCELDARLAWRLRPNLELSLTGQNLLQAKHLEYKPSLVGQGSVIPMGVYAKITWKF